MINIFKHNKTQRIAELYIAQSYFNWKENHNKFKDRHYIEINKTKWSKKSIQNDSHATPIA